MKKRTEYSDLTEPQLVEEMSRVITGSIMTLVEAVVKQRVKQWIEFIVEEQQKKGYVKTKITGRGVQPPRDLKAES